MSVLIVVDDVAKSRYFYETILGQKVEVDFGENIGFVGGFAIHKKTSFNQLLKNKNIISGSNAFELYFEDDNLELIERKVKEEKVEFIHGIVEQPWKQKVMRFYDYDKNIIEVGERLEHLTYRLSEAGNSIDEISKLTSIPKQNVDYLIKKYMVEKQKDQ